MVKRHVQLPRAGLPAVPRPVFSLGWVQEVDRVTTLTESYVCMAGNTDVWLAIQMKRI